jgi:hypothetical protein
MTNYRDAIAAVIGVALGVSALAGVLYTDVYAQAASAEARGNQALFQVMAPLHKNAAIDIGQLAANEAGL